MGYDNTPTRDGERRRRRRDQSLDGDERREMVRIEEGGRRGREVAKKGKDEESSPPRERTKDKEIRRRDRDRSSDEEDKSTRRDRESRRRNRSPDEEHKPSRRERNWDNRRRDQESDEEEKSPRRERARDKESRRRNHSSDDDANKSPRRERTSAKDNRRLSQSSDEKERSPIRDRARDRHRRHEEDRSPRCEKNRGRESRRRHQLTDEEEGSPRRERTRDKDTRRRSPEMEERREPTRIRDNGLHVNNRHTDGGNERREATKKGEGNQAKPLPLPDPMAKKTGGIYVPPFKLARMMREVEDKSSEAYQRLSWDALRKSINGLVNKVNGTNIKNIIPELLSENLIRGRGLFCRSCMKSQMASPGFTDVFAAFVAVVNTKFPEVGKLLVARIVLQLKRAYKRNDKPQLLAATKFVAHLVNQLVAHEVIALELLTVLLENPSDDSVEVAVGFVKECGALLQDISPQGLHGIFERFRGILHEGEIDKRVQFLIEGLFAIRKAKFQGFPAIRPELDLVEQEDQFTHEVSLADDDIDPETHLDIFKPNPNYLEDEKAYENLKKSILGAESSDDEEGSDAGSDDDDDDDDDDEDDDEEDDEEQMKIKDETETNLVNLRRTIYLTIMSSVDFEEAGHKLLKIKLEPGQEMELCIMLLECCSQERTYLRYYGLLGQRFCMLNKIHQENFEESFRNQYSMIHRLETNKLRNVAKFFAHLLATNALSWHVLAYIRLTEEDTTSSSRIFIKILFQELSEHLGIRLLNETLNNPDMQESFENIFPKDNPKNTRFAINFFTSIGLGGITETIREYWKNMPRLIMQQQQPNAESDDESGNSSGSSSASGSESDSTSHSKSSSDEKEKERRHTKRRKRN